MNHCLLMMGGIGSRFGADRPKQYVEVDGRPVFIYILKKLSQLSCLDKLMVVSNEVWIDFVHEVITKYIGAIVDCAHGAACERIEKKIFEPRMEFSFEGEQFWGSKGYENYLRNLYGDYMSLPPKEKRITHHDFKAYFI